MLKTLLVSKTNYVFFSVNGLLRLAVLLCIIILAATTSYAQQPFITTWKTDNTGTSNSTSITIPTTGAGYNYEVDWNNDGVYDQSGITGNVTHNFGVAGIYTVRIRGSFPRILLGDYPTDRLKLLDVAQWGDIAWTSMNLAFGGCANLNISATDLPDLSGVTDMTSMFQNCTVLNGPANIGNWNTANVTHMERMFAGTKAFNQPIGNWNTGNVSDMGFMFEEASAFNQPIDNWNTASLIIMEHMFFGATSFNQPIGSWNTANVTTMGSLFCEATNFNQPIGNWNTAKVINMEGMFFKATAFNQPIGNWNTASAVTFDYMFCEAAAFNQPIGNWNTVKVTRMVNMFQAASAFNQPIGNWNTSVVNHFEGMFADATAFNQSLAGWLVRPFFEMTDMLNNCGMDCENYSATLNGWNSNPGTRSNLSLGAAGRLYGTNAVAARTNLMTTKGWIFTGDAASGTFCPSPFITTWKTDNIGDSNGTSITIPTTGVGYNYEVDWNNDGIYDQAGITGDVTHDFGVAGTYTIRIRGTFPQIYFRGFGDKEKLLDVAQWGDIAWASMGGAFSGCSNLNISATDVPNLSGVTDMAAMFQGCTTLDGPANIGDWNTSNVQYMDVLFSGATAFNRPIGNWNISNVRSMFSMFEQTEAFNQPIGSWNTANVTDMAGMFFEAAGFNQPIGGWNTANVRDMGNMFNDATTFNQYLGAWSLESLVSLEGMLTNSGLDCDHYSATLIGWNANPNTPNNLILDASGRLFGTNAIAARDHLDVAKGWIFTGDGFSGTECSALPVTLISFTGKSQGNGVLLTWETTSETNNAGFEIEKSADARTFEKIGFVDGAGDSQARKTYNFRDINPLPTAYYRLKQLDYAADGSDGKFEYSRIISVKQPREEIVIYPNPATHNLYVKGLNSEQKLIIRNTKGQVVHKQRWSVGNAVKVDHLPSGPYFLSVGDQTKKVIVGKQNP
ncbi:BspA family leucine-rich repeat surface protein [Dyadobacter aurulentus]|uniref:BspA family leucine-rich repeat surface protein n=1 Tax=Dyadobacter sp. UC 10 TaxID=2605428 RepID=UPI0011F2C56B|nr:BspA family leucine-rich repeat surface protein [Dyadobacter sp. UC 10]KAA0992447.1 BspA family leucine-rich repeat surface protein [Dyadobacter sp. UC 10]